MPSAPPPSVNVALGSLQELQTEQRYEVQERIGEGGMGEVFVSRDRLIGRDVAMKVIRAEFMQIPEVRARFEREARVQGQLEHPAVVPVYDLGIRPGGAAFFTMKRVRGQTLEEIIDGLAVGDHGLSAKYTLRRLLSAFSQACLAVAYAHARGVLHRDLKPGNIMLGEYGEVHILDWGLAKITSLEGQDAITEDPRFATKTAMGQILGTPGYMAPEQMRGDIDQQGPPADVYALGAMLFELLTLEPLHNRGTLEGLFTSTLSGAADARASARAPSREVPPELDAVCVRATALEPSHRYPTAMELHEALERFLDGDRDIERRRALAAAHAAEAERAAEVAARGGEDAAHAREQALQEVRAALAFDPRHPMALRTLAKLLLSAPAEMPPEARQEFESSRSSVSRVGRRAQVFAYAAWLAGMLLALPLGIRGPWYWVMIALMAGLLAAAIWAAKRRAGARAALVVHAIATLVIALLTLWMGPFIIVPALAAIHTVGFVVQGDRRYVVHAATANALAIFVPTVLQWAGVIPPSYVFHQGGLTVLPRMTELPPVATPLFLLFVSVGMVVIPAVMIRRARARTEELERRLFMHGWNLRHLVPDPARSAAAVPAAPMTRFR